MAKRAERPSWFKLFVTHRAFVDAVPDHVAGKALKMALAYFDTGELPSGEDPLAEAVFASLKPNIDEAYADFRQRVENGRMGGRPARSAESGGNQHLPEVTNANHCKPMLTEEEAEEEAEEDEEADAEAENSFNHSGACARDEEREAAKRRFLHGDLGKGVVMLSEDQIAALLDELSVAEFDKYVGVVADMEQNGHHYKRKTHYKAILDMALKDRKVKK